MKQKHPTPYAPLFPYLGLTAGAVIAEGELVIDNFAGGGGASTGLEQALGRPVDIAINHDEEAIAMHRINHPHTQHFCESVWEVDPRQVTAGRKVALAWFSPDCKHFSKAKGGKPVNKEVRGLAWVALRWAATVQPRVIVVENVEEFKTWGPLGDDGRPCPQQSGRTFRSWVNALTRQGYQVQWRELRAYEYGAPTSRKRLFIVARRDGQPITWPEVSHGKPTDPRVVSGELSPWLTAAQCIDWAISCPSIFTRKKPLVVATNRRIAQGILRYTLQAARPFVVTCNHQGDGFRGQGLDEPMKTLTAAHDAHGLVAAQVVRHNHGQKPADAVDEPARTVTTQHNHLNLVTAALAPRYSEREGQAPRAQAVDVPSPTVTTDGNGTRLAVCQLTTFYGEKKQGETRGSEIGSPIKTQTSGGNRHALTAATIVKIDNQRSRCTYPVDAPTSTLVTKASKALATAQLVRQNGGHCQPQTAPYPADGPVKTITSQGKPHDVLTAQLVQYNGTATAQHVGKPAQALSTVERFALTTAQIVRQFGTGTAVPADAPIPTIMTTGGGKSLALTAVGRSGLTQQELERAWEVYAFLTEHLGAQLEPHADHGRQLVLVQVDGETYVITDIGMRMLEPRELYRAQGFPETYRIDFLRNGKPLPKRAQVKMCGNAVPPPFSRAIALANLSVAMQEAAD
ncbi:DNA cytosine methyltransferase [Deinococcus marmoris]|uniref:DNA cytosine methyltransferase n=1 Tax=Deinococcus marmoris TaxID=249408 RepID=UPI000690EC37|nr:DNA cytosine methyltransferase [Deinococcus marmoris]